FNDPYNAVPYELIGLNDRLFFRAWEPLHGFELWTSDGTPEGTFVVQDIGPGGSFPDGLTVSNGSLFFFADDDVHGRELWRLSQFVQDDATRTTTGTPVQINVLANDYLGIGTITSISSPPHGTAVLHAGGTLTYTPNPGFSGVDSFTYTITN